MPRQPRRDFGLCISYGIESNQSEVPSASVFASILSKLRASDYSANVESDAAQLMFQRLPKSMHVKPSFPLKLAELRSLAD